MSDSIYYLGIAVLIGITIWGIYETYLYYKIPVRTRASLNRYLYDVRNG